MGRKYTCVGRLVSAVVSVSVPNRYGLVGADGSTNYCPKLLIDQYTFESAAPFERTVTSEEKQIGEHALARDNDFFSKRCTETDPRPIALKQADTVCIEQAKLDSQMPHDGKLVVEFPSTDMSFDDHSIRYPVKVAVMRQGKVRFPIACLYLAWQERAGIHEVSPCSEFSIGKVYDSRQVRPPDPHAYAPWSGIALGTVRIGDSSYFVAAGQAAEAIFAKAKEASEEERNSHLHLKILNAKWVTIGNTDANGYRHAESRPIQRLTAASVESEGQIKFDLLCYGTWYDGDGSVSTLKKNTCPTLQVGTTYKMGMDDRTVEREVPNGGRAVWQVMEVCNPAHGSCEQISTLQDR